MNVRNERMFHYHKLGIYDAFWFEGSQITVDNNFNSYYGKILQYFSTAVKCTNNDKESFDRIIKHYLTKLQSSSLDTDTIKQLLEESRRIIKSTNIYNRELTLEFYRKQHHPKLPSRLHSIWLADDKSVSFWEGQLGEDLELYEVSATGKIFKSSDSFIPSDNLTTLEMYNSAREYWNPTFSEFEHEERAEYLFQGKINILKKIK